MCQIEEIKIIKKENILKNTLYSERNMQKIQTSSILFLKSEDFKI